MGSTGDWSFNFGKTGYDDDDSFDDPDSDNSTTNFRPKEHITGNSSRHGARTWTHSESEITAAGSTARMARTTTENMNTHIKDRIQAPSAQFLPGSHLPRPNSIKSPLYAKLDQTFQNSPSHQVASNSRLSTFRDTLPYLPPKALDEHAHISNHNQPSYSSPSAHMSASSMRRRPFTRSDKDSFASASQPARVTSKIDSPVRPKNSITFTPAHSRNLQTHPHQFRLSDSNGLQRSSVSVSPRLTYMPRQRSSVQSHHNNTFGRKQQVSMGEPRPLSARSLASEASFGFKGKPPLPVNIPTAPAPSTLFSNDPSTFNTFNQVKPGWFRASLPSPGPFCDRRSFLQGVPKNFLKRRSSFRSPAAPKRRAAIGHRDHDGKLDVYASPLPNPASPLPLQGRAPRKRKRKGSMIQSKLPTFFARRDRANEKNDQAGRTVKNFIDLTAESDDEAVSVTTSKNKRNRL